MLDPISDMITRIRNASRANHLEVIIPFSNFKKRMVELMKQKGFVEDILEEEDKKKKFLKIKLKYLQDEKGNKRPYIQDLQRVSRQGQRIYVGRNEIPIVKSGYGFAIISTSKGLMTNKEARKEGLGGEVICEVW